MIKAIKQLVAVVIILMTSTNIIMAQDNDLEIKGLGIVYTGNESQEKIEGLISVDKIKEIIE